MKILKCITKVNLKRYFVKFFFDYCSSTATFSKVVSVVKVPARWQKLAELRTKTSRGTILLFSRHLSKSCDFIKYFVIYIFSSRKLCFSKLCIFSFDFQVGWYPMGVCTRRVNCEGCFFTFCVGQPTDTLRDGLIRSIIFSK